MAMPKPMFRNKDAWLKYRKDLKEREKVIEFVKKRTFFEFFLKFTDFGSLMQ